MMDCTGAVSKLSLWPERVPEGDVGSAVYCYVSRINFYDFGAIVYFPGNVESRFNCVRLLIITTGSDQS